MGSPRTTSGSAPRVAPLRATELVRLPDPGPECSAAGNEHWDPQCDWARDTTAAWGQCGVVVLAGAVCIGYALVLPRRHLPPTGPYATTPISPDAAVLRCHRILDDDRTDVISRLLIQGVAALAVRRRVRAIETVGSPGIGTCCRASGDWLRAVGFGVNRHHPLTPRYRMDLDRTVRWKPQLQAAWQRFTGLVDSPTPPEPATYQRTGEPEPMPALR